ncbi:MULTISPECIES: hypothetical protein [Flavobacterium]|uniref:hypothetical protein n=1 Tax=Flavobacterium TaxID=237 RepID=UPI002113FC6A|nr:MULTISPECIES: hypothetical protein [Flavobacterium]UUF16649.1 hypothetical protein NLJ00_11155 [Flavobacterium panici]
MDTNYNRIKVADLEKNERDKILTTNSSGELEFSDVNNIKTDSYNALDYVQDGKSLDARQGKVLKDLIDNKVDKITGKSLVSDTEITRLASISNYIHPANHPPSIISQDTNNRFVTDTEKTNWNSKQSLFTGVTNFIAKSLNPITLISSRLFDDGTFFGIGTISTPSKDITLGKQINREIGIEQSDSSTKGRDLIITAGRTINYNDNPNFNTITQNIGNNAFSITGLQNNSVYASRYGGDIYKQTDGLGPFSSTGLGAASKRYSSLTSLYNNVYDARFEGDIYMQTNGTGPFTSLNQGNKNWFAMGSLPNNNVYAAVVNGDVYMQTNGTGNFLPLNQTSRAWSGLAGSPTNNMYAIVQSLDDIYIQLNGMGNFIPLGVNKRNYTAITVSSNNNIYVAVQNGDIYMQTNGIGPFVATGQISRDWTALGSAPNGNVYAMTRNGDIYMLANSGLGASNLDGGTLKFKAGTAKGNGKSRIEFITGQKTTSGTNMQIETSRAYIDENGYMIWLNMPTYADNSTAIAAGLPVGCEYKTATGDRKIVY